MSTARKRAQLAKLLRSPEPSIRWRTFVKVLGEPRESPAVQRLEQSIRRSPRVRAMLSHQWAPYRAGTARNVYYKWQGVHWVLSSFADIGYPRGDPAVGPLIDRALDLWLRPSIFLRYAAERRTDAGRRPGVPVMQGRARRCASQQGNALGYVSALHWPDERAAKLAELLQSWQWPDGGWNCDTHPEADSSSFEETLLAMRGLAAYARISRDSKAKKSARGASEVFLKRHLFRRRSNGEVMDPEFLKTHFPMYWHYDVLAGLKGLAEVGCIRDSRCAEALDWLESKELTGGGWPCEAKYYRVSSRFQSSSEFVEWGKVNRSTANEWVTTDALFVLREAGRLSL